MSPRRAGVHQKGVHAFRRGAAAQMKRLGMNDSDILEVMDWKDVTMLRRYVAKSRKSLPSPTTENLAPLITCAGGGEGL